MSTQYKHGHEVPTAVLAKRLDELSDAVGKQGEERDRELTRRVPAELDRDADLVLLEASTRLLKMEAEVARLTRQVCEVAGEADWADHIAETSREELEEVGGENYSLKQERDAALEQVIYWRERAVGAEGERDALAAHARRAVTEWEADDQFEDDWIDRIDHLLKCEAPAVSLARMRDERAQAIQRAVARARRDWAREDKAALARRDLLKQADALDEASSEFEVHERARMVLHWKAQNLRRQAEESTK